MGLKMGKEMRDSIHDAISSIANDMLDAGLSIPFTQKELSKLGVEITRSSISPQ